MLTLEEEARIERLEALVEAALHRPLPSYRLQIAELARLLTQVDPCTRARIERLLALAGLCQTQSSGIVGAGAPRFKRWTCAASGSIGIRAAGAPLTKRWTCAAFGSLGVRASGAPNTKKWTCAAVGSIGILAAGAPHTKKWTCAAVGSIRILAAGAPATKRWTCVASGSIRVLASGSPNTKRWTNVASGTVTTPFDPATLNLTGWWRLIYPGKVAMDGGAHWVGTASAGTSGAHDLSKLVGSNRSPHDGATLNGMLTANFQTTTADILEEPTSNAVLFAASAGSAWFLVNPNVIAPHSAVPYQNGTLLTDGGNAETDFCFTSSGAGLVVLDSGGYQEVVTACGGSAWHLLQFKWNGSTIKVRVDSGAWVSAACGPWAMSSPGAMQLGSSFADSRRFDGLMADIGTSATVISDANFDNIKSYVNARYGLSL
jgi:hypothetical protein